MPSNAFAGTAVIPIRRRFNAPLWVGQVPLRARGAPLESPAKFDSHMKGFVTPALAQCAGMCVGSCCIAGVIITAHRQVLSTWRILAHVRVETGLGVCSDVLRSE